MLFGIITTGLSFIISALKYFTETSSNMSSNRRSSSKSSSVDTRSSSRHSRGAKSSSDNYQQRMMTFINMPTPHHVGPNLLAKFGFIYSRRSEATRCVGCRKVVNEWGQGDSPDNPRFHRQGCQFIKEDDEPLDLSISGRSEPGVDEPVPMEDSPPETLAATNVSKDVQPVSLPVKIFQKRNTQPSSMPPVNLIQSSKQDSSSSNGGTDELPIQRLTPVDMINEHSSSEPTPLPIFTHRFNRSGHVIQSEPIRNTREHNRPSGSQQHQPTSGRRAADLPQEIANLDMRSSENRLESFRIFWSPSNVFTNIHLLVLCGFFCFGQGDAVECFYCGTILANWSRNDDPRKRHLDCSPDCRFALGENCGNVPLPTASSQQGSPSRSSRHSSNESSRSRNRRPTPRNERSAAPPSSEHRLPAEYANLTQSQIERNNLMLEFPCENPYNEEMRDERKRFESLENSPFRANTRLRKSNMSVAQAGMYYDGVGDCTKCWYCGGGLKDYLPNEDPWIEHAKFYPECEYLLQQRGPAWVTSISIQNPNIQRPPLPHPPSSGARPVESSTPQGSVLDEAMRTQPVVEARRMGFSDQLIRQVQQRRILRLGSCYQDKDTLIEALLNPDIDPTAIEPAATQAIDQAPTAHPSGPGPRPGRRNIIIAGGNFIGPNAVEAAAAAAAAQHGSGSNQTSTGQSRRRNVVIAGGNFIGPSVVNGQLHRTPSSRSVQVTINGQSLPEYLANQGEPMEVQTPTGAVHFYNNHSNLNTHGSGGPVPPPPMLTGSSAAISTVPTSAQSSVVSTTPSTTSRAATSTSSSSSRPEGTAEERLEALQREQLCKVCLNARSEVLFHPCNHVCCCVDCARQVTDCPVCRRRIIRYVRIYHS